MNRTKKKVDTSSYLFDNRALVALIIPLIIEQFLAVLVGMADSIMIANVGEAAVSGVSLVDQVMVLLINLFSALATGGAVVAGQYLGQGNRQQARKSTTQLIWFMGIMAVVITGLLYIGKFWILHGLFGRIDADVMGYANVYLMIVTASIPFIAVYNAGAAIFRTMGNSGLPMKVSVFMNVINVTGNAILIYGLHRGAEGVAIPTLVSRMAGAVVIVKCLLNQKEELCMERNLHFRPEWGMLKKILGIGIPNGLENSMFQLGKILVLSLVSGFGTYAIAANAVANTISLFSILPGMAINMGITSVIARCVGYGDYEQVKYYNKKLLLIVHMGLMVSVGIVLLLLPVILKVYNLSAAASEAARNILWFHGICTIFIWPESFALPSTFRACGDARTCMIISTFSMWVFRVGFSYILSRNLGMGVFGVWVAMIIDWAFRVLLFGIRYFQGGWKKAAIV